MRRKSNIKQLLAKVAARGEWGFTTGIKGHPPSETMRHARRRGLVVSVRKHFGWNGRGLLTSWFLTDKGKEKLDR